MAAKAGVAESVAARYGAAPASGRAAASPLSGLDAITVGALTLLKRRGFNESNRGDPPAGLFFLRRWMCI